MRRRSRSTRPAAGRKPVSAPPEFEPEVWIFRAVALVALIVPLTTIGGADAFRLPKDMALRAGAIILVAVGMLAILRGGRFDLKRPLFPIFIAVAALAWTVITAITASNRHLAADSVIDVAASVVLFIAAWLAARKSPAAALLIVIIPAGVNAGILASQMLGIWNPFHFDPHLPVKLTRTALIGNPNDVGVYFLPALICAAACAAACRGTARMLSWAAAILLFAAIVAAQTLTAIVAAVPALLTVIALRLRPRRAAAVAVVIVLAIGVGVLASSGLRAKGYLLRDALAQRDVVRLTSGRAPAFIAAAMMFRDSPILGVGPGCFGWKYFDYKIAAEHRFPRLRALTQENFGEVHNDHLQFLAEAGLPAYAIFVASLIALGAVSLRKREVVSDRAALARLIALPLAVALVVVSLAQFPSQIAAPRTAFLVLAAFAFAWSESVEA